MAFEEPVPSEAAETSPSLCLERRRFVELLDTQSGRLLLGNRDKPKPESGFASSSVTETFYTKIHSSALPLEMWMFSIGVSHVRKTSVDPVWSLIAYTPWSSVNRCCSFQLGICQPGQLAADPMQPVPSAGDRLREDLGVRRAGAQYSAGGAR